MAYTKILTGKMRLSYPHLHAPVSFGQASPGADAKYSASFLIDKNDVLTVGRLQDAIEQAKAEGIRSKWGGKTPTNLRLPLRDGDTERDGEEYKDHYFINCTTKRKPRCVDRDCVEILDPADLYAGCYVRATLTCYAYDFAGNRGISFGLCNVQKLGDGDPLGGDGSSAASDFGNDTAKTELSELDDF